MSILKSTNSGAKKKITPTLLKQMGYKHPITIESGFIDLDYGKFCKKVFCKTNLIRSLTIYLDGLGFQTPEDQIKYHTDSYFVDKLFGVIYHVTFFPETIEDIFFLERMFVKYISKNIKIPVKELEGKPNCLISCLKSKDCEYIDEIKCVYRTSPTKTI